MSSGYRLYTFFRSTTAWRARIACNIKKLQPEFVFVHLFKGQQRDSKYKDLNPNQGVPTLQLKDGTALIESMAIIEYLDEVHPQPKLFPGSAVQRAQIRGFCEIVNSGIHPYQNIRLLDKIEADFKADKMAFAKYFVFRGLDTMEKMLARSSKKYCFGDELTAADVFLYPQALASVNRFGAVLSNYQNIDRVMTSLKKIPEFVQAEPQNQQDFEK